MNEGHLSDLELEAYVYEQLIRNQSHQEHLQSCSVCQANLKIIQNWKTQLSIQTKPGFSFDLVTLVMPQIESLTQEKNWISTLVSWLIALSIISTICLMVYFRNYFSDLMYSLTTNGTFLLSVPVIFYMIWSGKDLIQSYRNNLDHLKTT